MLPCFQTPIPVAEALHMHTQLTNNPIHLATAAAVLSVLDADRGLGKDQMTAGHPLSLKIWLLLC